MKDKNAVALTPPMGWNSWDVYGPSVNEEQLLGNARYMADHLKEFGWEYVVCDIQWSEPNAGQQPLLDYVPSDYVPFAWITMDEYGRQLPAVERFPSAAGGKGFGPIAEKIHSMGLKFGIHIMRGVPRLAVHQHLPVKGANTTCDKIASNRSICWWNTDMYGVDAAREGAQAYYDSIFELYASWGVDFVKVDDICNTNAYPDNPYSAEKEIELIRKAIDHCGRDMVLSLSPGPAVIEKAWHLRQNANMWRVTDDFWDRWELLLPMFERCEVWERQVSPGCWPDCDMLPLGADDQQRDAGQRPVHPEAAHQPGDPGNAPVRGGRPPGIPHRGNLRLAQCGHPGRRDLCSAVQFERSAAGGVRLLGGTGALRPPCRPGPVGQPGRRRSGRPCGRSAAAPRFCRVQAGKINKQPNHRVPGNRGTVFFSEKAAGTPPWFCEKR